VVVSDLVGIRPLRSEGLLAFTSALLSLPTTARSLQHGPRIVAVRQTRGRHAGEPKAQEGARKVRAESLVGDLSRSLSLRSTFRSFARSLVAFRPFRDG
jgi:hypothetical protein